jgi:hypothetical protein
MRKATKASTSKDSLPKYKLFFSNKNDNLTLRISFERRFASQVPLVSCIRLLSGTNPPTYLIGSLQNPGCDQLPQKESALTE